MIACHIASLPERSECLKKTVSSVYGQVNEIHITLNGYTEVPKWLLALELHSNHPTIHYDILDNALGDSAKFLHCWEKPATCLILDDDLYASPHYVPYMIDGLRRHGGAVSLHGKCYAIRPIQHFKRNFTSNYRCLGSVAEDVRVDVIGTGCLAFDNTQVKFNESLFEQRNMADVLFSRLCWQQGVPMTVLKHDIGIIRYMPQTNTIWRNTHDDRIQTEIINSFLK